MTVGRGMFRVWWAFSAVWATAVLADFVINYSMGFYAPNYFQFGILFPSERTRLVGWFLLMPIKIVAVPLFALVLGLGVAWVMRGFSTTESPSPIPKGFWGRAIWTLSAAALSGVVGAALLINNPNPSCALEREVLAAAADSLETAKALSDLLTCLDD